MGRVRALRIIAGIVAAVALLAPAATDARAQSIDAHSAPWRDATRALVLDAYEYNELDWTKIVTDRRIAGFIGKATDGLPTEYGCRGAATVKDLQLCKLAWRRYVMSRELYHTRKTVAKALGLKWGAYHLGRAGNPIEQADHFLDFAKPEPDDLIALDIEENNPREFLSLEDAEIFARRVEARIGRWPVLYTNGTTAKYIADNRERFPILSRMRLWYARYKPGIGEHFPKGNWQSYTLWQFASQINCTARACPYRVPGTNRDIDVNVSPLSLAELSRAWPFDGLEPIADDPAIMMLAKVPVPETRPRAHPSGTIYPRMAAVVPVKSYLVPRPAAAIVPDATIQTGSLGKAPSVPPASYPYQIAYMAPAPTPPAFAAMLGGANAPAFPQAATGLSRTPVSFGVLDRIATALPIAAKALAAYLKETRPDRCSAAMNPLIEDNTAALSLPLGKSRG